MISIVIPNWNGKHFLSTCLDSLLQMNCSVPYEIIIVDNGSRDGSIEFLEENYPDVKIIALNENTGFFETKVWDMLYAFQKDAVKGIINKILKHNGCVLADSVGLGKTFEALAVIKYFELLNYYKRNYKLFGRHYRYSLLLNYLL